MCESPGRSAFLAAPARSLVGERAGHLGNAIGNRGTYMKRLVICALALGGFAASAQAADLSVDSLKDPLPDKISFAGVTVYGTVDVGYAYQTAGWGTNGLYGPGVVVLPNKDQFNGSTNLASPGRISSITNNGLTQSFVGVKVEEAVGGGFTALGKVETRFDPVYGELVDHCKTLINAKQQNVNNLVASESNDGSACGQIFSGDAYGGISHSTYGTLTVGRQSTFVAANQASFDPNHLSYQFSAIGASGTWGPGAGSTEISKWDESVKYFYQLGPVHAGVLYAFGGDNSAIKDGAVGANIGATYKGLSVDAAYQNAHGVVNAAAPATATPTLLNATITNDETWQLSGKYTFELGGGFKDEPGAKLSLFGGYYHTDMTHADHDQTYYSGTTIGGYQFSTSLNNAYVNTKTQQVAWTGAAYETGPWTLTAAYYWLNASAYDIAGATAPVTTHKPGGDIELASGVVDYAFNKHFDVYGGVTWSGVSGDWVKGAWSNSNVDYSKTDNTSVITGLRLKF
jgi:predicted porin